MKSIDEYISLAQNMPNTSDGGSPAYHFDDGVVLVKYIGYKKYGLPRKNEEKIMEVANQKRAREIRTPRHLAIKREENGEELICWVLQERAKGHSFQKYYANSNEPATQLKLQEFLANIPDAHYDKMVEDLYELFHMGLETKPKNIFYDENTVDGGFTFIDLLDYDGTPLNPSSIEDIVKLMDIIQFVYNTTRLSKYDNRASEEEKEKSKQLRIKILSRVLKSMQKTIPNFDNYSRWLLRTYNEEELEALGMEGIDATNLNLDEGELAEFDAKIDILVKKYIGDIVEGRYKYWQIEANEIRIDLKYHCLDAAWRYHGENKETLDSYESESDYEYECTQTIQKLILDRFDEELDRLSVASTNPKILEAKKELDKRRKIRIEQAKMGF